jgi:hypothetical protein
LWRKIETVDKVEVATSLKNESRQRPGCDFLSIANYLGCHISKWAILQAFPKFENHTFDK